MQYWRLCPGTHGWFWCPNSYSVSQCSVQVSISLEAANSQLLQAASNEHVCESFVLETPEDLQGELVGEEHGGAHGEASYGVDRSSAEENLQARTCF